LAAEGKPASEVAHLYEPLPQVLESVRFQKGSPLTAPRVAECIKDGEARLNGSGRLLVRKSGTEPVIRVMAEGDDEALIRAVVNDVVAAIQEVAA
jgi:phosphoglucosamine mutase